MKLFVRHAYVCLSSTHTHTHTHSQTYYLERNRVAQRPNGEGNFNIFYQLIAGADDQLRSDLLLNAAVESDEPNLYFRPLEDVSLTELCVDQC